MGKSILALVLLGVAIIHLGGATEEETDTQVAQQESQLDLIQVQELADARKGNKCGKRKKNCRRNRTRNRNSGKNKCRGKGKKGKCRKHKKKKTRSGKRSSKQRNSKKKKKRRKQQKRRRRLRKKQLRQGRSKGAGRNSTGGCEAGCSAIMVSMMKAARKQNTYLKQFNRLVNGQKQAKKKGLKKSDFDSNATDGPLALLLEAGGGNKSNKAGLLMKNLTEKLGACQANIGSACNDTKMTKIKASWTTCNTSMVNFKTASDDCLKKGGVAACTCFNDTAITKLLKEVENCSGEEMLKASNDDKKLLKACKDAYGECRRGGESIRPVLSACQVGGRTEAETKKDVGVVLKNEEANTKLTAKIGSLKSSAGRKSIKRREVTFNGATYPLTTCTEWIDGGSAWLTTLDSDQVTDIADAGTTIADSTVTCSAADVAKLTEMETKAKAVAQKVAKKKKMLQKKLEKMTGSTISSADAAAAATKPGGPGMATKAGRRRNKILAEFRQRF